MIKSIPDPRARRFVADVDRGFLQVRILDISLHVRRTLRLGDIQRVLEQ